MKKLILLPTLAMFACIDTSGKETAEETGTTEEPAEASLDSSSVSWGADSVTLDIAVSNNDGGEYFWGIAETNGDCLTSEWGCWTGEDCYQGFDTESGNLTYCHPISETGGNLSYGASPDGVAEGMDTVFSNDSFSSITTHIVDDQANGNCWVFGADVSYYSGYSTTCTEM